ncbi:hypothetical protein BK011_06660 [Tenericutes bacterium MZ-XQ]|nr:hypothetical protein BK011_06660 [Tenericutes bacterium MZ-XQ]
MRELKILNKNYEVANLYTVVYEGYTIKEIIEDAPVYSVTPPQHYLDYWQKIYDYFKTGTKVPGYTYLPQGQSKYDVAYTNKTIDDPIAELNGHTLREVFEEGNILTNPYFEENVSGWSNYLQFLLSHDSVNKHLLATVQGGTIATFGQVTSEPLIAGDKYFHRSRVKSSENVSYLIAYYNGSNNQATSYVRNIYSTNGIHQANTWFERSLIFTATNVNGNTGNLRFGFGFYYTTAQSQVFTADYSELINISRLGIDNLSQAQLEEYYSLYVARKNITKKVLTYADIFEEFQLLTNPDFNDGTNGWTTFASTLSELNNNLLITGDGANATVRTYNDSFEALSGEKIYYNAKAKITTAQAPSSYYIQFTSGPFTAEYRFNFSYLQNVYNTISGVFTASYNLTTMALHHQYVDSATANGKVMEVDYAYALNIKHFDELITKEQLDTMLAHYLLVKNIVIYPEIYVPTDPTGFGNRYAFLEINKKVYGHELDFENMNVNLLFGVYKNAYDSYNQLMNFIIGNEGIISYDYGKGVRYSDIRLIKSPKTELDDGRYLKEKFDFKRLTPFYTLEQGSSLTIKNTHDWDLKLVVSGTVNTNIVYIEAEETTSGLTKTVKFDFTAVTKPFNFYYNSETKQILINGINNGYQYIDFIQGISFISLPKDTEHLIWTTGITSPSITVKKWVID